MSKTLFTYIGLKLFLRIAMLTSAILGLIILIDFIEALREVSKIQNAGMQQAITIVLLRSPKIGLDLAPFVFLLSTMWALSQLNRSSEIAVMRSAGVSIWSILLPGLLLSLSIGVLIVTVIDPVASYMSSEAVTYKNKLRGKTTNLLQRLDDNIWLRAQDDEDTLIIHARNYNDDLEILESVIVWRRSKTGEFKERWDASLALIRNRSFLLQNAKQTMVKPLTAQPVTQLVIPSPFTLENLTRDARRPETMSIWQIPAYLELARQAGLPSKAYELRFMSMIALPFKLLAMVLIAATFSLSHARSGQTTRLLLISLLAGFVFFVVSEIAHASSLAGIVPSLVAIVSPVILAILLAMHILLKTEEG